MTSSSSSDNNSDNTNNNNDNDNDNDNNNNNNDMVVKKKEKMVTTAPSTSSSNTNVVAVQKKEKKTTTAVSVSSFHLYDKPDKLTPQRCERIVKYARKRLRGEDRQNSNNNDNNQNNNNQNNIDDGFRYTINNNNNNNNNTNETKNDDTPILTHSQIELGKLLGKGAFSSVYEIKSIIKEEEQEAQQTLQEQTSQQEQEPQIVVKFLRSKLYDNHGLFAASCSDLVKEGNILSTLNHSNVIRLHALSSKLGVNSYLEGYHDSYFLVLERLEQTLSDNITEWQIRHKTLYEDNKSNMLRLRLHDQQQTKKKKQQQRQQQQQDDVDAAIVVNTTTRNNSSNPPSSRSYWKKKINIRKLMSRSIRRGSSSSLISRKNIVSFSPSPVSTEEESSSSSRSSSSNIIDVSSYSSYYATTTCSEGSTSSSTSSTSSTSASHNDDNDDAHHHNDNDDDNVCTDNDDVDDDVHVDDIDSDSILNKKIHDTKTAITKLLEERLDVAIMLADAITYLHKQNVIHRDLKPDNIGFDKNGILKVFDFDIARVVESTTTSTTTTSTSINSEDETFHMTQKVGSPRYMSPECARREQYNLKADVYSYGLLFHQIITLQKPYDDISDDDHDEYVFYKHVRPSIPNDLPTTIKQLLECSWSPIISNRPKMYNMNTILKKERNEILRLGCVTATTTTTTKISYVSSCSFLSVSDCNVIVIKKKKNKKKNLFSNNKSSSSSSDNICNDNNNNNNKNNNCTSKKKKNMGQRFLMRPIAMFKKTIDNGNNNKDNCAVPVFNIPLAKAA